MTSKITRRELITGAAAVAAYALLPRTVYAADPIPSDRLPVGGTWEGLVGVEGGIPNRTVQFGSTIQPYSGSPSTINSALDNCPADQVVQLAAGTFNISGNIYNDGNRRTLRGAVDNNGQPATTINFTTDASVVMGDMNWDFGTSSQ